MRKFSADRPFIYQFQTHTQVTSLYYLEYSLFLSILSTARIKAINESPTCGILLVM
jgi:hypothetical protein